jgi:DNA invertase Pin-like site-specific DNA recombinase
MIHQGQKEGIAAAKARGVTFGRPQTPLPLHFPEVCKLYTQRKLTVPEAAKILKISLTWEIL